MINKEILWPDAPFDLEPSLVLLGRRGSEAHGTFISHAEEHGIDDRDLMGICIPPVDFVLGMKEWEHSEAIRDVWDVVLYDMRKFVCLLLKQNPNTVGMLWLEKEDYLHISDVGQILIDNRNMFRSRDLAHESFCGYARGQLHKMEAIARRRQDWRLHVIQRKSRLLGRDLRR